MTNIPPDAIKDQLDRILAGSEFLGRNQTSRFLCFVVEQTLNGQSDSIKQYSIAVDALGYGIDFDPQSNPAVRIEARRLRRSLDIYYHNEGIEDPIRIVIPKGGYVPRFLDNHTPSKAPGSSECTPPVSTQTSRALIQPTIAVITFDYLNDKPKYDYVAIGLTEELIIALNRFPEFRVIGPLRRNVIHEQNLDSSGIGQVYGVRFVLEGTLRTKGQLHRLTVRLSDAHTNKHLWGKVADCKLQDGSLMEFENDVVSQVVCTIADNYGVIPRVLTKETFIKKNDIPVVYNAMLHAYNAVTVLTYQSLVDAIDALEKALRKEPQHAHAMALLSDLLLGSFELGAVDSMSTVDQAEELARKALTLDPTCQVAHFNLGVVHFLRAERTLCLKAFERAVELNPNNSQYIASIGLHTAMTGEWERGVKLMDKACSLNPHHAGWHHILYYMKHYRQGEYDLALIEAKRFNTPGSFWDPLIRAAVLGQLGRKNEAGRAVEELLALVPDFKSRGRSLLRRITYLDEHVDMLAEGLRKAGLEVQ